MQPMLAISGFHANDSSPSPKLDTSPDTSQPDCASWILEAATSYTFFKEPEKKLKLFSDVFQ
jgi:hypothetical protein